jgi:hypothetical protein
LEESSNLIDPLASKSVMNFVDTAKARTCRLFGEEKEATELFEKRLPEESSFWKYLKLEKYATGYQKWPGKAWECRKG